MSNKLTIISVIIVEGKSLNNNWNGKMQIIKTNEGDFIDNLPGKQYGEFYNPKSREGYDWAKEVGKDIDKVLVNIIPRTEGKWLQYK